VFDALVLAGGAARRLGGVDKSTLTVGGASLLDRVLQASRGAERTVVVGPDRPTSRPVHWTRELPVGAGPVAAVAAGLALVTAPHVVLLAADLPFLQPSTLEALLAGLGEDGAVLVDDTGREQWLCSAWRTEALRGAELTTDRLSRLLGDLRITRLALPVGVGEVAPWVDCDTQEDLQRARELA
jgi:molybdopterin-guanine dinucleotide biosynthesis protein A